VIDQSLLSRGSCSSGLQNENTGIRPEGDKDNLLDSPQIQSEPDPRALRPPVIQGLHQLVQQSAASFQEENFKAGSSKTVLENIRVCTEGSDEQAGLEHVGKHSLASDPPAACHSQSGIEIVVQESKSIHETELMGRHPVAHLEAGDLAGGLNQSHVESLAHQRADVQEESELPAESPICLNPPLLQSQLSLGQEAKAKSDGLCDDLRGFELKDVSDERASRQLVRLSIDQVSGVSNTHSGLDLQGLKDKDSHVRQLGDKIDDQQSTDVLDAGIQLEERDIRTELQPGEAVAQRGGASQLGSQPSDLSEYDSVMLENVIGRPELDPMFLQLKEQHKACVLSLGPCVKSGVNRGAHVLPVLSDQSVEENEGCDFVDPEPEEMQEAFVTTSGRSVDMSQLDPREQEKLQVIPPPPEAQSKAELDGRDKLAAQIESELSVSSGKLDQVSEDRNYTNVEV
jgi:hypothetical protein